MLGFVNTINQNNMTREKVIALLVKERTDARNIAYQFKADFDIKVTHGLGSLSWHYKKLADVCRQIGNAISGGNALAIDETIEDRIKREYAKELLEFEPDPQLELQFDEKPWGAVIRVNTATGCKLRMCQIPKELVFDDEGEVKEFVDITYPKAEKL